MKKHIDILATLLVIAILAGLIAIVSLSKSPEPLVLDLKDPSEKSTEHRLIEDLLQEPEAKTSHRQTHVDDTPNLEVVASAIPVAVSPLPAAWASQPAPTADQVELSPALQRSFAGSASLRTEDYINPSSDLNHQSIDDLRAIRQARQAK